MKVRRACIECPEVYVGPLACPKCGSPGEPLVTPEIPRRPNRTGVSGGGRVLVTPAFRVYGSPTSVSNLSGWLVLIREHVGLRLFERLQKAGIALKNDSTSGQKNRCSAMVAARVFVELKQRICLRSVREAHQAIDDNIPKISRRLWIAFVAIMSRIHPSATGAGYEHLFGLA
mgnify:CR=1 FL=1